MERFMDLANQLALEHKMDLSLYDASEYQKNLAEMVGESVATALLPDPTKYCDYIDRIIGYTNKVTMAPEQLIDFYSKIYKSPLIDQKNITIPVQTAADIDKIRPEYLTNIPMETDRVIKGILNGTIKESDIRINYVTGEYFNKVRKQMVKTTIPYNTPKDMIDQSAPAVVRVTSVYIQASILPFLSTYRQNVKDLVVIAENAKGRINNTCSDLMNSMRAVESMEASGKLDVKQRRLLSYFRYNMYRQYMNLCAYLVTTIIRKMKFYTYNIMSYINLYNTIYNYFPEGENILHEYVVGNDISDLDDATLLNSLLNNGLSVVVPHIQNTINKKKIELSNYSLKKYDKKLDFQDMDNANIHEYDNRPYAAINQSIMNIANDLHVFEVNSQDPNLIVDDVLSKSNLDEPFMSQYTDTLSRVDSMDFYTAQGGLMDAGDNSVLMSLYSDLSMFEKNIGYISGNIAKVYQYISALQRRFETNVNDLDNNTYNEYKSTIDNVMKNFKEYALQVAKKLLSRLDNMVTLLEDKTPSDTVVDPTPDIPSDYSTPSYLEAYNDICILERAVFESLMKEYYAARAKKERGVKVVFEDVQVQTDANAQHSQNNNNTNTQNNNNGNTESIIERFKKWLSDLLNKFTEKSGRLTGTNDRWLASVKADILNLDTSNTTISLANYEGVNAEKILADINSATNKVNGINANQLPADLKSKKKAETYIFSNIPAQVGNEKDFVARTKQFLTFGNTDSNNLTSYSGEDAKTKIANIIQFCEGYGNTYKNVSNALKKLGDAAAKKQQEIINALGTQAQATVTTNNNNNTNNNTNNTNNQQNQNQNQNNGQQQTITAESVMTEAEAQTQNVSQNGKNVGNDKSSKEKMSASSMVTSVVREYTGAVLTSLEKKYLDYIKVLNKLAPKKANTAPDQKGNDNNTNETNK